MRSRRPWQPHLDRDPLFNPFVPTTARPLVDDHVEFTPEEEGEEGDEQTAEQMPDQTDVKPE
jgi:hypothetical protein